jgi:uncharacterized RDD family membrane protein YckC
MSTPPRQLDSRIEIVTPENIAFEYVLAGPFRRLPAFLIDVFIRAAALFVIFVVCIFFSVIGAGSIGLGMFLIIWFGLSWFYGGLFETLWNGQTPGKRLLGLRVLSLDGQPINALQAVLRNVLRDVDAQPMVGFGVGIVIPFYMLALIAMASNNRFQRLGDLASGTIVVVERRSQLRGLAAMTQPEVVAFALNLPVNFAASRAMSQALSIYVARRDRFSPPRRFEIARTLAEPLCERWGLPADTNPDLLLCALYYRTFIADRAADERGPRAERLPAEVSGR